MISSYNIFTDHIRHKAVTSCLLPICTLHGLAVTTIEGIGNFRSGLNPVQERLVKFHGTQCGFCTPGMVMSMYSLLRNNPQPTLQEVTNSLHGNICRCTGYRSIIDAFGTFAKGYCSSGKNGGCCLGKGNECCCRKDEKIGNIKDGDTKNSEAENVHVTQDVNQKSDVDKSSEVKEERQVPQSLHPLDPSQELIFPPELKIAAKGSQQLVCYEGPYVTWYKPIALKQAVDLMTSHPGALVAAGFTYLARKLTCSAEKRVVIDVGGLPELKGHVIRNGHVVLGAALTMSEAIELAEQHQGVSAILSAIPTALTSWHSQLRNSATIGGHVMLKKPKYDLLPLLVAGDCCLNVASKDGINRIPIDRAFCENEPLTSYTPSEVIVSVEIPASEKPQFVRTYKVAKRKHQDFASLSAAFVLDLDPKENQKINRTRVVFGGSLSSFVIAEETQIFLTGRTMTEGLVGEAIQVLISELTPLGMSRVQLLWAQGFLTKCCLELMAYKQQEVMPVQSPLRDPLFTSKQIYEINKAGEFSEVRVVGQPLTHSTAEEQATGEAIFVDDIAPSAGELFLHLVLSTKPHAKITGVDLNAARSLPGVVGHVDSMDVPGVNYLVPMHKDEPLFATDTVQHYGELICGIVADDRETAERAAALVNVTYEDKTPVILTIEDAIAAKSFHGEPRLVCRGDTSADFAESDHVLEGEFNIDGQRHFYMETQCALAVPKERGEIEVLTGTQMPYQMQITLAEVLSVPAHKVSVRVKRMGGAFGGKETRSYLAAVPAAVAAVKYQRPVRCVLTRKDDTQTNGGRHPVLVCYKVGFKKSGRILCLDIRVFLNGGSTIDASYNVMGLILLRADTSYSIPSVRAEGRVCRTNLSSKGAFRGFGVPQMYFAMENIIATVATHLKVNPDQIRELNLYREGETTLGDVLLKPCTLRRCWHECKNMAGYEERLQQIAEFNRNNTLKKRGIALQPAIFGIGIFAKFLNQGGAFVNVYTDGSVLVTHGGCEMGQGLHTKIKQIASEILKIEYDKVLVSETSTSLVPNATASGASMTTDVNGGAVHAACLALLERLRPFREADPSGGWDKWVSDAYFNRVSLSATGFYKFGDFEYDFTLGKGPDCMYFTYGAGCSEVELDCLTGEHQLLRTDIVMDVGRSLNPAIDIGQIEGAFVQGYGHFMMEHEVYDGQGRLLSDSHLTYKVPLCSDIPAQFNVALLKNSTNNTAIYSSKGVGEPPLLLSTSAYQALREAVKSAREERGLGEMFVLPAPAIPANVVGCLAE